MKPMWSMTPELAKRGEEMSQAAAQWGEAKGLRLTKVSQARMIAMTLAALDDSLSGLTVAEVHELVDELARLGFGKRRRK
ncbi:MAG: hypothetical protein WAO35_28160 [Terriglobia bacterium]